MKIHLPGRGKFIRSHVLQSMFEQGHSVANGFNSCDSIIDVRGPSRPQDFIDGRFSVGGLYKEFLFGLDLNIEARRPYLLLSSTDVEVNNNPYTAWKLAQESALHAYSKCYGFPSTVIRTSCVFGPEMDERRFIPLAAGQILRGEPVAIHVDAKGFASKRQWTYAPALALWIIRFTGGKRVFNTNYVNWTLDSFEMAQAIARVLKKELIMKDVPFYDKNPGHFSSPPLDHEINASPIELEVALRITLYSLGLLHAQD